MVIEPPIRPELPEMLGKDGHLRERRCLVKVFSVLDLDPSFAMGLFSKSLPSLMSLFVSKLQRVFLAIREEIPNPPLLPGLDEHYAGKTPYIMVHCGGEYHRPGWL